MYRELFTDAEWQTARHTTLWAFYATCAAEGEADPTPAESAAFSEYLDNVSTHEADAGPLALELIRSITPDVSDAQTSQARDRRAPEQGVREAMQLLEDKVTEGSIERENLVRFKVVLAGLVYSVANADGGRFFGLGRKVSASETRFMDEQFAQWINWDQEEVQQVLSDT